MNTKAFLPLALIVIVASLSGCAHQTTRTGSKTNLLFGLVEIERGAYQPTPVNSLVATNSNELIGNAGKPSGTQTKIAWGLITNNDY